MHFAAFLDVGESVREPARYYRNNVVGALSVLEAMVAEQRRYFVFSSTCATYGEPIETPIAETHPQRPINSYGETKLAVERALSTSSARTGSAGSRSATSMRPARIPTARSARITRPRFT